MGKSHFISEATMLQESSSVEGLTDRITSEYQVLDSEDALDIPQSFIERINKIGDTTPMYVTWAMPSGFSRFASLEDIGHDNDPKKPHRYWPEEVIFDFAEQINERQGVVGYGGHGNFLSNTDIPENTPVYWIRAAKARRLEDNRGVTLVRGYVTRQGNYRENITLGIIDSASVNTLGTEVVEELDDGVKVKRVEKGAKLLSFDLVRKYEHGVPGTRIVANVAEEQSMNFTAEMKEVIASLNREQLESLNPGLVSELAKESVSDDTLRKLQERLSELIKENVEQSRAVEELNKTASHLGVSHDKVVEAVEKLAKTNSNFMQQAVDMVLENVKSVELRKQLAESIKATNPSTIEEIHEAYKRELAKLQSMVELMAGQSGLGDVVGSGHKSGIAASFLGGDA